MLLDKIKSNMKVQLYHGTSVEAANEIIKNGFKSRPEGSPGNWPGALSQESFVYLTRAYPFFYGMAAADEERKAAVIKVEVDIGDCYPDEDFLQQAGVDNFREIELYKDYAELSLNKLGNIAIKPDSEIIILDRPKEFDTVKMSRFSDPSMNMTNYRLMGGYYRKLTDEWWEGNDWEKVNASDEIIKSLQGS